MGRARAWHRHQRFVHDAADHFLDIREGKGGAGQIQDIELSRLALQNREKGLLKELKGLKEKENSLDEEEQVLKIEENRLKQYESDLNKKQQELEDYYSKSWYTRVWDNVSSTWRNE